MNRPVKTAPQNARLSGATPTQGYSPEDELRFFEYAELSQKIAKRPLVLFFGRDHFSDNTKYLYLAAAHAARGYEVLWCCFDPALFQQLSARGLPCFDLQADFRRTCQLLLEASVALFCTNLAAALGWRTALNGCLAGAQKIQLWHGVSVKQLNLMLAPHFGLADGRFRQQLRCTVRAEHFVSTSSQLDAFWVRAFGCTSLVRAGQPRNEVIVRPPTPDEMIGAEIDPALAEILNSSAKRKVLLVPTWQRGTEPLFISTPAFYTRLAAWAARNNAVVVAKAHPFLVRKGAPENIPGRVYFLGAGVDVYPWMSKFDALITDYSSIMFDFLLLHRPIFTFDARSQVQWGYEPDYSLIPEGEFRYEFRRDDFEAVFDAGLANHRLHAAQRQLSAQLFETPADQACAQLLTFIGDCTEQTVDKSFTLTTPQAPRAVAVS
jgi:CDP-glycerol glycerophosphotransferase